MMRKLLHLLLVLLVILYIGTATSGEAHAYRTIMLGDWIGGYFDDFGDIEIGWFSIPPCFGTVFGEVCGEITPSPPWSFTVPAGEYWRLTATAYGAFGDRVSVLGQSETEGWHATAPEIPKAANAECRNEEGYPTRLLCPTLTYSTLQVTVGPGSHRFHYSISLINPTPPDPCCIFPVLFRLERVPTPATGLMFLGGAWAIFASVRRQRRRLSGHAEDRN